VKRTLLLATLLAACGPQAEAPTDTKPAPTVSMVGDTAILELPVGKSANNGDITVTFDGVSEDSRCPEDVQCVWAGNGAIRLTLEGGDEMEVVIVNSTLQPREVSFFGYVIGFRDLTPYPATTEPSDPGAYVATISVVGAQ
jgi:ABC-type glycerol-3-phosphate transport system substrate-binding protein